MSDRGCRPLATLDGDPEELRQQLAGGANPNDRTTGFGNLTRLHLATASSSRRAVQTLIEAGADLEARDTTLGTSLCGRRIARPRR